MDLPVIGLRVLITGAAGMLGRKLAASLITTGALGGSTIESLVLADVEPPPLPAGADEQQVTTVAFDLADVGSRRELAGRGWDVVFHLAAIVSGEAEAERDRGYAINLDGTRDLFDALRVEEGGSQPPPRVVFASSIAVFGAPFPDRIADDFHTTPATSYGTQKAIGELLLSDHSRRGSLDGVAIRLPTICIRPGAPNRAASGFFSNILREPLVGEPAVLPVDDQVRHWFASPRTAVGFLEHAATIDTQELGARRVLNMPGVSATVGEQLEALRRVAGDAAVSLVRREPDPAIEAIVGSWAHDFDARRARELGFSAEASFDDIVQVHIEDELGGKLSAWEG